MSVYIPCSQCKVVKQPEGLVWVGTQATGIIPFCPMCVIKAKGTICRVQCRVVEEDDDNSLEQQTVSPYIQKLVAR